MRVKAFIFYLTYAGVELFEFDSLKGGVISAEPSGSKPRSLGSNPVVSDGFGDGAIIFDLMLSKLISLWPITGAWATSLNTAEPFSLPIAGGRAPTSKLSTFWFII